jgi:uncharacterized membrane protein YecN with MAPEG domain
MAITAFYAGLSGLWLLFLSAAVIRQRRRHDVSVGDGGVLALTHARSAHSNACENIPIALILMALAETMGMPGGILHLLGLTLLAGRVLHGWYFLTGATRLNVRIAGMLMTFGVIGVLAVGAVFHGLARML